MDVNEFHILYNFCSRREYSIIKKGMEENNHGSINCCWICSIYCMGNKRVG